jgi:hypothetical protein
MVRGFHNYNDNYGFVYRPVLYQKEVIMSIKLLVGHTSAETAYVIADYPYSFNLRCQKRMWVETSTRKGTGQRVVSQTSNPRKEGLVWNKPSLGVYSVISVIYLNSENNHVECAGLGLYTYENKIEEFVIRFGEVELCKDPYIAQVLPIIRKFAYKSASST